MKKEITVATSGVYDPRALAELVGVANDYVCAITIEMDDRYVNAKSIMGIMGLGLDVGKVVTIVAEGEDEIAAVAAVEEFLTK